MFEHNTTETILHGCRLSTRWQRELKMITIQEGEEDNLFWDVMETKPYSPSPLAGVWSSFCGMF